MTRLAIYLQDAHPITEAMAHAQYAESQGFEAVWQADSRLVREAGVPMAAFAATTDTLKVGSGVIDIWTRNPARLASMFSTLDDLAPGRIICGLGAWWEPLASKVGVDRRRPLLAMREIVAAVRGLLNNETVTMDGEFVHLDGVELDYVHQERRVEGRADLCGGDRHEDDGADRRDRRWGGAQLSRVARLQQAGDGAPSRSVPSKAGRSVDDHRSSAARGVLGRRGSSGSRSTAPACWSPNTSVSSRTS